MSAQAEEILDRCIEEKRFGKDPERILGEHPDLAGEVRPLLALVDRLGELSAAETDNSPLFRTIANLAVASPADGSSEESGVLRCWTSRATRAAAGILIFLVLGWGAATASAAAVPGDLLYPVKLLTERVKFFLAVNAEEKAELRIVFADRRLREALKKHRAGGGIDKELLKKMLEHARLALEEIPDGQETSRGFMTSRVAATSELHKRLLQQVQAEATPEEAKELQPFIDRCGCQCGSCGWGSGRGGGGATSPKKPPEKKTPQRCGCGWCGGG
jgi:hypothetical protein